MSYLCYYTPESVVGLPDNLPEIALLSGRYEPRKKPFLPGRFVIDNKCVFIDSKETAESVPNVLRIPELDFYPNELFKLCKVFGDLYSPIAKEVYTLRQPVDVPDNARLYFFVPNKVENEDVLGNNDLFYNGSRSQNCSCCACTSSGATHFDLNRGTDDMLPGKYLYHPISNSAYAREKSVLFDENPDFVQPSIGWIDSDGESGFTTSCCVRAGEKPEPHVSEAVCRILCDYFGNLDVSNVIE